MLVHIVAKLPSIIKNLCNLCNGIIMGYKSTLKCDRLSATLVLYLPHLWWGCLQVFLSVCFYDWIKEV